MEDASNGSAPALDPPLGVTPNFVDPPSLDRVVIGTFVVCLTCSTLSLAIRFHAQLRLFGRLTWADLLVSVAWACHVIFDGVLLSALPHGLGRHQWDVPRSQFVAAEYLLYISFILYDPAILFAKLSILTQFLQLFSNSGRNRFWYTTVFLCAINILFYIPLTIALIFSCTPREKIWNPAVPGTCVNLPALLTSSGPFNVISDFLIFLLPIWAIWHLRVPLRKRFCVGTGLAIGLFGCICSAVRIAYSARLVHSGDRTFVIAQNQMWANAECTVGILIANFIILPRYIKSFKSERTGSADEETMRSYDLHKYLSRKKNKRAGESSGDSGFEWDQDGPMPQGAAFNQLTSQSRHTNTLHSRLSEELDLRPEDRQRVAPWAAFEENMSTAQLWTTLEKNGNSDPARTASKAT